MNTDGFLFSVDDIVYVKDNTPKFKNLCNYSKCLTCFSIATDFSYIAQVTPNFSGYLWISCFENGHTLRLVCKYSEHGTHMSRLRKIYITQFIILKILYDRNMATDLNSSFNEQYMNINTKLKKRFLRKPNISEATNEFIALGIQCEHSEQPTFAAHAYVGAAKCEASAGNFLGEAEHYLAAARQFMKAEKKLKALKFYSPDRENLEAAIGSYMQALAKYPEKSPLRTSLIMEVANGLVSLNHKAEAVAYYEQALDIVEDKTMRIMCMRKLLKLQIDCGKFGDALETANKICDSDLLLSELILSEVQISRILLTLIVQPVDERKPESLKKLFKDLLDEDDENNTIPFNMDMKLMLQSLTACCATSDISSLVTVCSDAKQLMDTHQKDLLDTLVLLQRSANITLA